ncbi:hypothetical protein OROMI_012927 [Orobanche minor]
MWFQVYLPQACPKGNSNQVIASARKRQKRKNMLNNTEDRFISFIRSSDCSGPSGNEGSPQFNDTIFEAEEVNEESRERGLESDSIELDNINETLGEPELISEEVNVHGLMQENPNSSLQESEGNLDGNGMEDDGSIINIYDPRVWDNLAPKWKDLLVKNGPVRDVLVGKAPKGTNLAHAGIDDWGHLSKTLTSHERSPAHVYHMTIWFELRTTLETGQAIDNNLQHQIKKETKHWRRVLKRLFGVVKFLSKQSLAFRGSQDKIYDENNGNFMALVEMIVEWDKTLKEHLRRKENREIQYHYLSHKIHNELILLIALEVKTEIMKKIRKAKYFSVILDCTRDVSKQEQMTLLLRCVDVSNNSVKIEEYFLQFLVVNDTTGQGLFDYLKDALQSLDLDIDDIRDRIYTLFADSTKRWKILTKKLPKRGLTVKSLSTTRWESRIESVKAIVTQAPQILEALNELADEEADARIKSEAACLVEYELCNFEFIADMVIWYEILAKVNVLSKTLQSENMQIDEAMNGVKTLVAFFKDYREKGFDEALNSVKVIASDLGIDPVFVEKRKGRKIRKKRHFDEIEEEPSQIVELSPQESFRIQYFLYNT